MQRIFGFLVWFMLLLLFAACQPTPGEDITKNKGDSNIMEIIEATPSTAGKPAEGTMDVLQNCPGDWRERIAVNDKVDILIDAKVCVPPAAALPVIKIEPCNYTRMALSQYLNVFFPDTTLYKRELLPPLTKAQIEKRLIELELNLAKIDGNTDFSEEEKRHSREIYAKSIDELRKQYSAAPEKISLPPYTLDKIIESNGLNICIAQNTETGETVGNVVINASNGSTMRANVVRLSVGDGTGLLGETPERISLGDYAAAGSGLLDNLDIDGYTLNKLYTESRADAKVHVAIYTREYFGIPVNFVWPDVPAQSDEAYSFFWMPEYIMLRYEPGGALSFEYRSPSVEGEVMNTNVTILPFNKIQNIFRNQAANMLKWFEDMESANKREIMVRSVELSYMRVSIKNRRDEYMLIPVWDFYGLQYDASDNGPTPVITPPGRLELVNSIMTINAIDGSIIDRNLGY